MVPNLLAAVSGWVAECWDGPLRSLQFGVIGRAKARLCRCVRRDLLKGSWFPMIIATRSTDGVVGADESPRVVRWDCRGQPARRQL